MNPQSFLLQGGKQSVDHFKIAGLQPSPVKANPDRGRSGPHGSFVNSKFRHRDWFEELVAICQQLLDSLRCAPNVFPAAVLEELEHSSADRGRKIAEQSQLFIVRARPGKNQEFRADGLLFQIQQSLDEVSKIGSAAQQAGDHQLGFSQRPSRCSDRRRPAAEAKKREQSATVCQNARAIRKQRTKDRCRRR